MHFYIMTLFPEMFPGIMDASILGRAKTQGLLEWEAVNIRDYTLDKHMKVDDYPYGGGAGMVMQAEPIYRCYEALQQKMKPEPKKKRVIYVTPQGHVFDQKMAEDFAKEEELVFLCGYSRSPSAKLSVSAESLLCSTPGTRREIVSIITIAGSSPPVST